MITETYERLRKYSKDRGISLQDQQAGYIANISKEIGEAGVKIAKQNDVGIVAELCDLAIIVMNACDEDEFYDAIYPDTPSKERMTKIEGIRSRQEKQGFDFNEMYCVMVQDLMEFYYMKFFGRHMIEAVIRIELMINSLGFDFEKVMGETLKKIESREGYWDTSSTRSK
ncbi:hypothetical protein [Campylobacter sputorum]|uniref:hypothetical protein n=1 Tax=Campylobacter sputorum TaxID=206 RepID=UPI00053C0660|nr:hypothetical protein [Campylobacter sputorum]